MIVRLAGVPSRDRVAVWRELRKIGAAPLSQGVWTVPDTPYFGTAIQRVDELAGRGSGDVLVVSASGAKSMNSGTLDAAFRTLRIDEWAEFDRDCAKFEAEIGKVTATEKFTLAELEEKEQSLDRLRRWYHDLKKRDALELPEAAAAETLLHASAELFEAYAEKVYSGLHAAHANAEAPTEPAHATNRDES